MEGSASVGAAGVRAGEHSCGTVGVVAGAGCQEGVGGDGRVPVLQAVREVPD